MSDDLTKEIAEKYQTKPTIETVLEGIAELRTFTEGRFDVVERRLDGLENRMEDFSAKRGWKATSRRRPEREGVGE